MSAPSKVKGRSSWAGGSHHGQRDVRRSEWTRASSRRPSGKEENHHHGPDVTLEEASEWPIEVQVIENRQELIEMAMAHYNRVKGQMFVNAMRQGRFGFRRYSVSETTAPHDLDRLAVNYIRHRLSNYEALAERVMGTPIEEEACHIIFQRVMAETAGLYPYLAEEVERQLKRKETKEEPGRGFAGLRYGFREKAGDSSPRLQKDFSAQA